MITTERDQVEPEASIDQITEWEETVDADVRWREATPWVMSDAAVYAYPGPRSNSRLTCYRGRVLGLGRMVGGMHSGLALTIDVGARTAEPRLYTIRLGSIARIESWNPDEHEAGIDEDFAL
jgi:hypothetical protein